jgi:FtsH-binding integral membrane protein
MKIFNVFFIIVFIFSAALQYNDPDPYIWMPIYLFGAYLCYQAIYKKYNPTLYFIGLVVYIGYAAYLFFDKQGVLNWAEEHGAENIVQTMKATKPWIEETREFGGLLILIVVLLVNMIWLKRKNKRNNNKTS